MEYINTPAVLPGNMQHHTFFCELYGHELGYNIYLPDGYENGAERYPVFYHLHGWTGNESSEIHTMYPVCCARNAITVFPNSSPVIEDRENLPVEDMLIQELIPLIDSQYRTQTSREGRGISGFSMGGGAAMVYGIKHPELFSSVTAFAGTYHHYFYYKDFRTVGAPTEKAAEFYHDLLNADAPVEKNILKLVAQQADAMRKMQISLHIGAKDVLYCDNEILRLHLEKMGIPHEYRAYESAEHNLSAIL
ncbi:MAG: hypothetical protein IKU70_11335 [Clostridia bacterium]|nr:hypothetical protein [Clostridia bacterium]